MLIVFPRHQSRFPKHSCPACGGSGYVLTDVDEGRFWRLERTKRRITQKAVAAAMGLSAAYVSDLERGKRHWTRPMILRYMEALTSLIDAADATAPVAEGDS